MKNVKYKEWFKSAMLLVTAITVTEAIYFAIYGIIYVIYSLCVKGREATVSDIKNVWDKTKKCLNKILLKIYGFFKPQKKPASGLNNIMKEMARSGKYRSVSLDDLEHPRSSFESHPIDFEDVPEDIRRRAE